MKKDLFKVVDECADKFSTNKRTNANYKKIFYLIYNRNVIEKRNNDYGYAEIHSLEFKKITRKYSKILQDLFDHNLIYTNRPLNVGHTLGAKSIGGDKIIRGYKIDRFFDSIQKDEPQSFHQIQTNQNKINSFFSFSYSFLNSFPNLPINKGAHFLRQEKYDIEKIYQYIQVNEDSITYERGSKEWEELAKKWNKHSPAKKSRNRIYSWFHSIHGGNNGHENERSFFTLNGSTLRECFDVPACNFCLLSKMLEDNKEVDQHELMAFQLMIKTEYIYGKIAEFIGVDIRDQIVKKNIKEACQHWLNIRKRYKCNGMKSDKYFTCIDQYFNTHFHSIYNALLNWREEEYNGKITKMLWDDFQKVEFDIISNKICTYLHKTYEVFPVTVHDAIYLTDDDREKVKEKIEDIFWKELNLKYVK